MDPLTDHKSKHLSYVSQEDPLRLYDLKGVIGQGSFGYVCRATNNKTGTEVAIKILSLLDRTTIEDVGAELATLRECNSVHIVKYYESYFQEQNLWIAMEYCEGGSISDILRRRSRPLEEDHMARICRQALRGLDYIHTQHQKIHRDIKGGNILITGLGEVKLADFGVSAKLQGTFAKRNTFAGTPYWMAPEVILESQYDTRSDIWSLGITSIEMAELTPPYADLHPMRALFKIPKEAAPMLSDRRKWTSQFQDFVTRALQKNQILRPTARQMLEHPFVQNCKSSHILAQLVVRDPSPPASFDEAMGTMLVNDQTSSGSTVGTMVVNKSVKDDKTKIDNEFQRQLLSRSDSMIQLPWCHVNNIPAEVLVRTVPRQTLTASLAEIDPSIEASRALSSSRTVNLLKTYAYHRNRQDTTPMTKQHTIQTKNIVNDLNFELKMILS